MECAPQTVVASRCSSARGSGPAPPRRHRHRADARRRHGEASKLFAWYARDVWVCPADETHRYSAGSLADEESGEAAGDENPDADEPRVYEETEGTPTVSCGGAPVDDTEGSR